MKYLKLLRIEQWYKNLLVFAGLFFSLNFFNYTLLLDTFIGFISLSLISSAGYIINDILDYSKDKIHPEKKFRVIASDQISKKIGLIISICLYIIGFLIAIKLNLDFFFLSLLLAISTFFYSIYLKNIIFADILLISTNFIIRALSGIFLININASPWFLLEILFLTFFLVSGKRYGDLILIKKGAEKYKPVLKYYNKKILENIVNMNLTVLMIIFGLYASTLNNNFLFYLYPLYIYILLRYYYLILKGHKYIRNPEKFVLKLEDLPLIISSLIFSSLLFIILYVGR